MPQTPANKSAPDTLYIMETRYGTCELKGNPRQVLVPDAISFLFGSLGAFIADHSPAASIRDVGCGSGIWSAAVIMHSDDPDRLVLKLSDTSKTAVSIATQNVRAAIRVRGCNPRVSYSVSNLVDEDITLGTQSDVLYANLPYLRLSESVRERANTAPAEAIYGGVDGFDLIRELLPLVPNVLAPGGVAIIRTPADWKRWLAIRDLAAEHFDQSTIAQQGRAPVIGIFLRTQQPVKREGKGIAIWKPAVESPSGPIFLRRFLESLPTRS